MAKDNHLDLEKQLQALYDYGEEDLLFFDEESGTGTVTPFSPTDVDQ